MTDVADHVTKCKGCEEKIDRDGDGGRYSEIDQAEYCWGCFESDMEHASTITYLTNGEDAVTVKVGKAWIVDGEYYEDLPAKEREQIKHWYTRTDGWRGHWNTTLGDDWVEVQDGLYLWGEKTNIVTLGGELQDMHKDGSLPFKVALVADLTSNVFAAGCSIYVLKAQIDTWHAWYEQYAGASTIVVNA